MSGLTAPAGSSSRVRPEDRTRWPAAVTFVAAAALAVLALYLVHPIVAGHRFPIGPDGPVYTWLARAAEATGLPAGPGAGPGVHGLTLFLGSAVGVEPLGVLTVLGPVLAVACGLAAAGLVETALGPSGVRTGLAVILTGTFAAYLAGGWLANVALVATYLGALAAMAAVTRSWRAVALAAGLLVSAGLSHRVFLVVGVAILIFVVLARLPDAIAARRAGVPWPDTDAVRLAVALAGGAGLAGAGLAWLSGEPRIPGDTSQDGFFRRLDLRGLLANRYRERLWGDLTRAAVPVTLGLGLAVAGYPLDGQRPGRRFLAAVWLSWAAITAAGVAVLAITSWGPPNRILQFAFFIPVGGAVGAAALSRRGGPRGAMTLVAVSLFAAMTMAGWFRQSPAFDAAALAAAQTAGRAVASLPDDTPLMFVVDSDQPAAAYHVTLAGNLLRMGVPADRIADVQLVVGRPGDVLIGRPTLTGDPEHDRLARAYLREAQADLDRAVVIVVRRFNPSGYQEAVDLGTLAAPGVAVIPSSSAVAASPRTAPRGLGPASLVAWSIAALVALGLLGAGWSRWGLVGAGRRAAAAVAPSAGIGVAVVATFLTDRFGVRLDGPAAVAPALILGAAGYAAAGFRSRRDRPAGPAPSEVGHVLHHQRG
jgi:hypothetical protein